jgi:hypothetical protein
VDLAELFDHHFDLPDPGEPLDRLSLPAGGGVCVLTDADGHVVQTLTSQALRRSLMLRLDPSPKPGGRPRADLRAIVRCVWWRPTYSVFETSLAYLEIARQLNPGGYRQDLAFGPAWFARVNPQDRFPRWIADKLAFEPPAVDVGPFPRRSSCRQFIEMLEDLFDLCRYYDVLKQAPAGQACAYKDMGKCPAPCDGSVSMDHYRRAIAASAEFARGRCEPRFAELEEAMNAAAGRLQFEQAARLREQVARARKLLARDERVQKTPEDFRYLVVQRGGGTTYLKPFFVDRGVISTGAVVRLGQVDQVVTDWTDKMTRHARIASANSPLQRSESIWLVTHFLSKGDDAPGLFLHESQLSTHSEVAERIRARFAKVTERKANGSHAVDVAPGEQLE